MVASGSILRGQAAPGKQPMEGFSDEDIALLGEIAETIIPATDIPGAKAAEVGPFMAMMVTDCYSGPQHAVFKKGLGQINEASKARFGTSFVAATPAQRTELANALDAEQKAQHAAKNGDGAGKKTEDAAKKPEDSEEHYFRMMKELAILGYFSSKIGATQAVRYIEVPTYYKGDVPYTKGERAWY